MLKVVENLMLGKLLQTTVKKDRLDEVYSYFPILSERTGQVAGTLSGGEQQMLAIGRAIMSDPKIMLLDEPSDGIMPSLVKEIGTTLKSMSQKNNIVSFLTNNYLRKRLASEKFSASFKD